MFVFVCCEVATVGEPVESDHRAELLLGLQLKRTFRKAADAVGHWAYTSFDSVFCAAVAPMCPDCSGRLKLFSVLQVQRYLYRFRFMICQRYGASQLLQHSGFRHRAPVRLRYSLRMFRRSLTHCLSSGYVLFAGVPVPFLSRSSAVAVLICGRCRIRTCGVCVDL